MILQIEPIQTKRTSFKVIDMGTSEKSDLLPSRTKLWTRRYRSSPMCLRSKAVLLILFWSIFVSVIYHSIFEGTTRVAKLTPQSQFIACAYAFNALALCFFPLAGFLGDTEYGRFKTLIKSSHFLLLFLFLGTMVTIVILPFWFVFSSLGTGIFIFYLTSFSLEWTNFMTHQLITRVSTFTGMCGLTMLEFSWLKWGGLMLSGI